MGHPIDHGPLLLIGHVVSHGPMPYLGALCRAQYSAHSGPRLFPECGTAAAREDILMGGRLPAKADKATGATATLREYQLFIKSYR